MYGTTLPMPYPTKAALNLVRKLQKPPELGCPNSKIPSKPTTMSGHIKKRTHKVRGVTFIRTSLPELPYDRSSGAREAWPNEWKHHAMPTGQRLSNIRSSRAFSLRRYTRARLVQLSA